MVLKNESWFYKSAHYYACPTRRKESTTIQFRKCRTFL